MKKAIFILIILILSLLYYLGVLTRNDTLPFSKEFFSAETRASEERALDLKARRSVKAESTDRRTTPFSPKELEQLYQLKLDRGIRNVPILSFLLIREARQDRGLGNSNQSVEFARYAVKFSPDLPEPHFELSRALWSGNPLGVLNVLSEVWKGEVAVFRSYPRSLQFFYNVFYILANALLMTFIVFGIVLIAKYFPLYFYDIRKNMSQEMSKLLTNSLKLFILFIPFFLRLDILWAILFYSILLSGFVTKRERQFLLFFFLVLVYLPFFLRTSAAFLDGPTSDVIFDMNQANHEEWDQNTVQRLKDWVGSHPDDRDVIFTLGLIEKRQGHQSQAEEYYRRALQLSPRSSEALSNLGNVYFAKKDTPSAIASYQQAIDLDPQKAAYYYNLYRAYSQETFLSGKLDRAFQRARQLDPKLVEYYTSIDNPPHANRLVVDEVLGADLLWGRFWSNLIGREGFLFRLFKAWFEKIPSRIPFLVPLFFLGYLALMSRYVRGRRFLTRCPMCGSPTHRFYLGNAEQEYICFNCYRIYIQKEKLHPKITEKKSLQVKAFQKQNQFLGRFVSVFIVGFQDLWEERSTKGLLLLFVFFIFVLRFFFWKGVMISAVAETSGLLWHWVCWIVLFALFYFLSVRQILRVKVRFDPSTALRPRS